MCPSWIISALMGFFIFTRFIPNTLDIFLHWFLSCVLHGQSQGFHSWGSLKVFCQRELLTFQRLISLGVSALVVSIFVVYIWHFWRKLWRSLRKLRVLPEQPDLEDMSRFSRRYPYRRRIYLSLCSLFLGILWSSHMDSLETARNVPARLFHYLR